MAQPSGITHKDGMVNFVMEPHHLQLIKTLLEFHEQDYTMEEQAPYNVGALQDLLAFIRYD